MTINRSVRIPGEAQIVVEPPAPKLDRFRLIPFGEIVPNIERRYVVKDLIPYGVTALWGPPKSSKSFWCLDLALHIAAAWTYRGRKVEGGPVVYFAAEGAFGFGSRIEAFRIRKLSEDHGPVPFYLIADRLDLIRDHDHLIARIREQLGTVAPVAVFIDTLNRSFSGSESSDEDMTGYVNAACAIHDAFGGGVIVVHHCGVDSTRPRGHTSLTGAVEAQLAVKRERGERGFTVTVEFMKDGPEGDVIASRLDPVEIGIDSDGAPVTSCVVVEAETPQTATVRVSGQARVALDLLHRAIADAGEIPPASFHIPTNARAVRIATWREYCAQGRLTDTDTADARKKAFQRAFDKLRKNAIAAWGEWVWISAKETRP